MPVRYTFRQAGHSIAFTRLIAMLMIASIPLMVLLGCKKMDNPGKQTELDLKMIADNLVSPIAFAEPPDDSHRLFVVDQTGKIWIIDKQGNKLLQPFIDISSKMVTLQSF